MYAITRRGFVAGSLAFGAATSAQAQGDYERAVRLYRESLLLSRASSGR